MTLERGAILKERYRIVEILGQGGMGAVYRAIDENLGVEVALKENLFTTDEYGRQFRLEAIILASLRHPNLPRVTDHFSSKDGQGQYMVMDYIEGEDLRERMERFGSIPDEDAIRIGAAICDALDFLHSRTPPILHRDIKPGNIKITPDGHIYLVDFGLAKVVQSNQITTTGARAMTPGYSPPEQYGTARTDPRTDIYSLGATLYAALTGHIPEDGLARAMDNATLTPIRKHNPNVGRRLAAAIEKAMSIEPDHRFQSAQEFKKALLKASGKTGQLRNGLITVSPPPESQPRGEKEKTDEAQAVDPVLPPNNASFDLRSQEIPPTLPPPATPTHKGNGCGTALFLLLLFGLVTLAVLSFAFPDAAQTWFNKGYHLVYPEATQTMLAPVILPTSTADTGASPIPIVELTSTPTLTPTPPPLPTHTPTDTPTASPTPQGGGLGQILFVSERTGIPQLWIIQPNKQGLTQITNLADGACQPDWSPDGRQIVFISPCPKKQDTYPDASLYIMDADGSHITPLPSMPGGDFDPAWSPDGTRIAFTSLRDGHPQIYVYNLEKEETRRLTQMPADEWARYPAWSPGGTQIVYTVKRVGVFQIWLMTDQGDMPTQLVFSGPSRWDYQPAWSPDGNTILFSQSNAKPGALAWVASIRYDERDTHTATRVDAIQPLPIQDIDFSQDGFWLTYESNPNNNFDIYVSGINGSHLTRLTDDPANDYDPTWRPYLP